jgi:thiol-disulfide isomerase/thioredoxin
MMPDQHQIRRSLESATSAAVVLASVAVLAIFAWNYFTPAPAPRVLPGLQKGDFLDALATYSYSDSPRTLILALTTDCNSCRESLPFYQRFSEAAGKKDGAVRVVAVFPNSTNEVEQYLRQNQSDLKTISRANLSALNVLATPTLILVDGRGQILDFWIGKLAAEDEQRVINALTNREAEASDLFER